MSAESPHIRGWGVDRGGGGGNGVYWQMARPMRSSRLRERVSSVGSRVAGESNVA